MDYAHSRRIRLWGETPVEGDRDLVEQLRDPEYPVTAERAILFEITAWDMNCPQHIHRRYSQAQVAGVIVQRQSQIDELKREQSKD